MSLLLLAAMPVIVVPSDYSFALVRWLALYSGMLAIWAITSTRATMNSRRAFGRSKIVRWVSATVGLVVFVLIPALLPRLLLSSALLLAIAPVCYSIFRLYRPGTGLLQAVREGVKQTVALGFGIGLQIITAIAQFLWMVFRAILRFDWATLKKLPELYRQATERFQAAGSPGSVATFELLQPTGIPIDNGTDPRLKGLPDSILPKAKSLLRQASQLRAAEVVLQLPSQGLCEVAFKIDGILQKGPVVGREEGDFIIRAIQAVTGMSVTAEAAQSGTLPIMSDGERSDLLVDSTRSRTGKRLVLKFTGLDRVFFDHGLAGLGADDKLLAALRSLLQRPAGVILISGRRDVGKATTMYSAILEAAAHGRATATAERDFRHNLDSRNVQQFIVGSAESPDLSATIKAALCQKPEVLAVRDIVDRAGAEECLRAAVAGHLVLAILPADDAIAALERLLSLGVDRGLIRAGLLGILAQRLARSLCDACKASYSPTPELASKLGLRMSSSLTLHRSVGCPKCLGTGFSGRTAIFELLSMGERVEAALSVASWALDTRESLRGDIVRSLRQSAIAKVVHGVTSVEEASKVLK